MNIDLYRQEIFSWHEKRRVALIMVLLGGYDPLRDRSGV